MASFVMNEKKKEQKSPVLKKTNEENAIHKDMIYTYT